MFEANSQKFASAPRGFKLEKNFGPPSAGTAGGPWEEGGPSQPPPPLQMHLDAPRQPHGQQPIFGTADPGVVKQDKSSRGSVDTTKRRPDPQRVRRSSGERPIGTAKGKQPNTEALCQTPPLRPPPHPLLIHPCPALLYTAPGTPLLDRPLMYLGVLLIGLNGAIGAFLIVYVQYWCGDPFEDYHPKAIPVATASATLGFVFLTVALWPVYHLLTPFLMFLMLWGIINFASLL